MMRRLVAVVLLSVIAAAREGVSLRRKLSPVNVQGGFRQKKEEEAPNVPDLSPTSVARALGWTATEATALYFGLSWAALVEDRRLQITSFVIIAFGSSAIADALLSTTTAALSAPVRQILLPTKTPDQGWYDSLPKPTWNPPTWLFPVAWLLVSKPTQVLGLARLGATISMPARIAYVTHLALGDTWNRVFFGDKNIRLGVAVIWSFVAVLATASLLFAQQDPIAGAFLLPTLAWVTVAASLNTYIANNLDSSIISRITKNSRAGIKKSN